MPAVIILVHGVSVQRRAIDGPVRDLLVKTLGMLGSGHVGERDNAARAAERLRVKLDMTWDELVVRANVDAPEEIDRDEGADNGDYVDDEELLA